MKTDCDRCSKRSHYPHSFFCPINRVWVAWMTFAALLAALHCFDTLTVAADGIMRVTGLALLQAIDFESSFGLGGLILDLKLVDFPGSRFLGQISSGVEWIRTVSSAETINHSPLILDAPMDITPTRNAAAIALYRSSGPRFRKALGQGRPRRGGAAPVNRAVASAQAQA